MGYGMAIEEGQRVQAGRDGIPIIFSADPPFSSRSPFAVHEFVALVACALLWRWFRCTYGTPNVTTNT